MFPSLASRGDPVPSIDSVNEEQCTIREGNTKSAPAGARCCKSGRIGQDFFPGSRDFPFLTVAENQDVGETKRLLGRGNVARRNPFTAGAGWYV